MEPKQATMEDLNNRFTYHAPRPGQPEVYQRIRDKARELAELVNDECPAGREAALSLTKIEEAVMWANAGIARS